MIKTIYTLLAIGMMVYVPASLCMQVVDVKENRINKFSMSKDDMTRVYVKQDAITDVWTTAQSINIQQNDEHGEIFLTLKDKGNTKPVSMIIKTAKGDRINAFIDMNSTGNETVELITKSFVKHTSGNTAANSHSSKIIAAVKAMHLSKSMPGWDKTSPKRNLLHIPGISCKAIAAVTNQSWRLDKIMLTNNKNCDIVISPAIFDAEHIISVATTITKLKAGASTHAYVISEV